MSTTERAGDADDVATVPMSVETRRRLILAAERPLMVRRHVLRLAAHASGHKKHPHGEWCERCREKYPCVTVQRAASPALRAFEECDASIADTDDLRRVVDVLAAQPAAVPDRAEVDVLRAAVEALADRIEAIPKPRVGWDSGLSATESGERLGMWDVRRGWAAELRAVLGDTAGTLAKVRADTLREAAAEVDSGPTFPLPPSVLSALLRERADRIEAEAGAR